MSLSFSGDQADNVCQADKDVWSNNWESIRRLSINVAIVLAANIIIFFKTIVDPQFFHQNCLYVYSLYAYLFIMASLIASGYYTSNIYYYNIFSAITTYLVSPCIFFVTMYYIIQYILNRFFRSKETAQDSPPQSRGRGRKKGGKKRRR